MRLRRTVVALAAAAVIGAGGVAVAQDGDRGTGPGPMAGHAAQMPGTPEERDAMHARMSEQMPAEMREQCDAMHAHMRDADMGAMMSSMMNGGGMHGHMGAMMGGAK